MTRFSWVIQGADLFVEGTKIVKWILVSSTKLSPNTMRSRSKSGMNCLHNRPVGCLSSTMGSQDTLFPLPSTRKQSRNIYDVEERRRLLGDDFTEKLEPETLSKAWSNWKIAVTALVLIGLLITSAVAEQSSPFHSHNLISSFTETPWNPMEHMISGEQYWWFPSMAWGA